MKTCKKHAKHSSKNNEPFPGQNKIICCGGWDTFGPRRYELDYSNPVKRQISKFLFAEWGGLLFNVFI
jgi:hypothetical protein